MKTFCFTVDDNIRFFRDLSNGNQASLFEHPYLAMYKRLHEKYGLKIQLNLFYEMPGFDLSQMTNRFRQEWRETDAAVETEVQTVDNQQAQRLEEVQLLVSSQRAVEQIIPTEAPFSFAQPVEGFLDRDFSMLEPQYFPAANYYRMHPGIDLQAAYGTPVKACASAIII